MGSSRDTRAANWARTVKAARRKAAELCALDFQVTEPDNLETPPWSRIAISSAARHDVGIPDGGAVEGAALPIGREAS